MKNAKIISRIIVIDYAFFQIITSYMLFILYIIHIITISLLIRNSGLVSFVKANHDKHDKPVCFFILCGGIKHIKKIIL